MIKKLTNKKIVLISATVMVVVLILGFTLALWSNNFIQTGTNTITSDCFNIEYSESGATSLVNAYPQTDEDGLKNVSYDVTIENTCNTVTNYSVVLNELSTNTLAESHVKVSVNDSYKMLNIYNSATPSSEVTNASSARLLTQGVLGPQQERTIGVKSWMDEDTTELEGENKTFGYKITIEASTTANDSLASKIFATNNMKNTPLTFTALDYGEPTAALGASGATYKEVKTNYTTSISMTTSKYIGSGYTFNRTTGKYTLTNYELYTEGSDLTDKYTCNSTSYSNCSTMYKVISYTDENITESKQYTQEGSISGSGLFKALDDAGTSYYLRGAINNNYVSFANKIWRVVRINGDGSIRLILNDRTESTKAFGASNSHAKYTGYTYDNAHLCTATTPCYTDDGVSSVIKNYLENTWYKNNLENYDDYISISAYCNDTSNGGSNSNRTNYKCPDADENYGGYYKVKIGLLSYAELYLGGVGNNVHNGNSYLKSSYSYLSMTPNGQNDFYYAHPGGFIHQYNSITNPFSIRPVINLIPDVLVSSGNGTESTPYVISTN